MKENNFDDTMTPNIYYTASAEVTVRQAGSLPYEGVYDMVCSWVLGFGMLAGEVR